MRDIPAIGTATGAPGKSVQRSGENCRWVERAMPRLIEFLLLGALLGALVLGVLLPIVEQVKGRAQNREVRGMEFRVAQALTAHFVENGRYPNSLSELGEGVFPTKGTRDALKVDYQYDTDGEGFVLRVQLPWPPGRVVIERLGGGGKLQPSRYLPGPNAVLGGESPSKLGMLTYEHGQPAASAEAETPR
jgi:type II secretory pathway pseudopilin PulG